ncbi:MAG: F0F1 ATP synthase subunit delta [Coxiellaceae bacterium]|jgi:F-type H+-transporting ATPase subunit delta|nr:F0F1 ATP synthase subunit delta [Coxiellaceae bacterium]
MNNHSKQAISYAKAIFNLALFQQKLALWQEVLTTLAQVVLVCKKSNILANPVIQEAQKLSLFVEVTSQLPESTNLVKLLARRKKLTILPEIAKKYQQLFFTYTNVLEIKVVSAEELTTSQKEQLLNALQQRYQCEILLQCCVDDKLIGGAIIYVKDEVIDDSICGILRRLKQNLLLKNTHVKA